MKNESNLEAHNKTKADRYTRGSKRYSLINEKIIALTVARKMFRNIKICLFFSNRKQLKSGLAHWSEKMSSAHREDVKKRF